MSSPVASRVPISNALRCFRRNRRGSAAIEFALVAPVFFALLFAIIETATMFFASQVLETVTQDSARLIQTGQAQQASPPFTQAQFQAYVCSQIPSLFDCSKVYVDVESYPSSFPVTLSTQIDASGNFINNMQYSPGDCLQHCRREAVLSMAVVRHRAWLQHLESGRQPAAARRHGRVPQ